MAKFTLLVLTNAVQGQEDAFNEWYDNTHVPDVMKIPGIVSAQRFRQSTYQRGPGPHPWHYMALYEGEAPTPEDVDKELRARAGTPAMAISPALSDQRFICFFEPIGEAVTKKA